MKRTIAAAAVLAAALAAGATAASNALTLTASPTTVVYGKTTTLTGLLAPAKANQNVTVQAQTCGTTGFKRVTTVKTTATGAFTATVTPTTMTTYQATEKQNQSTTVVVKVMPVVALKRVARGSYSLSVTAGASLVGKSLTIQRYSPTRHRWLRVKGVALTAMTAGTKPTVVSTASFKSKLKRRTRVRALLPLAQVQPCYLGAKSNTVRA